MNFIKTTMLLGVLTAGFMSVGFLFGGTTGMLLGLAFAAASNFFTWFMADTLVLKSTGAQPIPRDQLPWLHEAVHELSAKANMPPPRLYITPDPSPNAFATGRSPAKGVVAVTQGLLNTLNEREVRGVIAHELGHIKNRDTLVSAISATLAGATSFMFQQMAYSRSSNRTNALLMIPAMMMVPMAASVIRMMISRTREYAADRTAAELTGDPEGLAMALEGLSRGVKAIPMQNPAAQNVHMAVNGFTPGCLQGMMSTHPPIDDRCEKLRAMR